MRVTIRVYPKSKSAKVGGRYGNDEPPVLIVRVPVVAVGGRANAAAIRLLASTFGVPARQICIVSGEKQRTKVVELGEIDDTRLATLLDED